MDTIIYIDYHEEDISLDPRRSGEDKLIPPGAEVQIDWATWLGKEPSDDDRLELWVYVDPDGWEVMRVDGFNGDITETAKLGLTAEAAPSLVTDKLLDILTGQNPLPASDAQT